MEAEAFDQSLRAFVARKPFRTFTVELVSGTQLQVDHPEALAFRHGVAVHFAPEGTPTLFDHLGVTRLTGAVGSAPQKAAPEPT